MTEAFKYGLKQARSWVDKASDTLSAVQHYYNMEDMGNAYTGAFTLAKEVERLAILTRVLPAYTGRPGAITSMERLLLENIPMRIGFTSQGWFGLVIPALLPKKGKGEGDYLRNPLHIALDRFFANKEPVRYGDCVMVVRHIYERERPERQYRDHDNVEVKMVIDSVALHVLTDDAPLRCAHYYCSAAGMEDETQVFVVPQADFQAWLEWEKTHGKDEVELHEIR